MVQLKYIFNTRLSCCSNRVE